MNEPRPVGELLPSVSIILPTFNRATFLPQALEAIRSQTFVDWELIVVDDGSTDGTQDVLKRLLADLGRPVRSVRQANQGAYGARNTGLDLAQGKYIAFFDSDDLWLPHHLATCVAGLEQSPEVDWVFSACRRVEIETGGILVPNTFYAQDRPWPFLKLRVRSHGALKIIADPKALACMIAGHFNCGLQASVIRRRFFEAYRFGTRFRNEAEEQMAVIWALAKGHQLAYFDDVHVIYQVHSQHSSATAGTAWRKRLEVIEAEARGYEELAERGVALTAAEERARRRRLKLQFFWHIGYALLWQHGERQAAIDMFRRGLRYWPWDLRCWKTYVLARLRTRVGPGKGASASSAPAASV